MKKAILRINNAVGVLFLLSTLNPQLSTVFAQGSLTPPGAPVPMMKSLDQIEARTPISSAPFTITQPGSYYLTANLNVTGGDAIDINTNDVTLDLNGFTVSSTAPSAIGTGILLAGSNTDITIFNGHIKGGVNYSGGVYSGRGFANGIYYSGVTPANVRVAGVSVSGCLTYGINIGTASGVIESCTVQTIGAYGLAAASVSHSGANVCGSYAIVADTASDCYGIATGSGDGLYTGTAHNCYGYTGGSGVGLYATVANDSYGSSNGSGTGMQASVAIGCYCYSVTGWGLVATIGNSCLCTSSSVTYKYNMP